VYIYEYVLQIQLFQYILMRQGVLPFSFGGETLRWGSPTQARQPEILDDPPY